MNPKHRGWIFAGIIVLVALAVGLYGYHVGSHYQETIVIAYQNLYDDVMGYLSSLAQFFKESLGVNIQW